MKVLVTGAAGYVGSHTLLALADAGHRAVALDDLSAGLRRAVPADVPFVEGNASDAALLRQILGEHHVEAVIHLAGSVQVWESLADPLKYFRNNVEVSRALIEACVAAGVRDVVFSSTAVVYGVPESVPIAEDAPTIPISPYGRTKLAVEWLLADAAAAHDLRYVALRYFNVAGADPQGRAGQTSRQATHLLKVACEALVGRRQEVPVFGEDYDTPDGTCVRDYVHVADVAQAHVDALSYLARGRPSLAVNCGYGRGYSVREVLRAVEREAGQSLPILPAPRRPGDAPILVADSRRIAAELGWRPRFDDLGLIVRSALAWERRLSGGG